MGLTLESDEIRTPNDDGWFYNGRKWVCEFPVWAENWPAISFSRKWHSQWRVVSGMSGVHYLGLDFGVILPLLDRRGLSKDEYDDMLGCLREIESVARELLNSPA